MGELDHSEGGSQGHSSAEDKLISPPHGNHVEDSAPKFPQKTTLQPPQPKKNGARSSPSPSALTPSTPSDFPCAVASAFVLLFVGIWATLAFGYLSFESFIRMPLVALELVVATVVGAGIALLVFRLFLMCIAHISVQRLRVFCCIWVGLCLGAGILLCFSVDFSDSSWGENLSNSVVLILKGLAVLAVVVVYYEHFPKAATLIGETSSFLLGKGRVVLAAAAVAGLVTGLVFILPEGMAVEALALDCEAPLSQAWKEYQQAMQDAKLSSGGGTPVLPKEVWVKLLGLFRNSASCRPWVNAVSRDVGGNIALGLMALLALAWVLVLFACVLNFLAAYMVGQTKEESKQERDDDSMEILGPGLKLCFVDSLGSLCKASFALLLVEFIFSLYKTAVTSTQSSGFTVVQLTVAETVHLAFILFFRFAVVPGLAIHRRSFRETCCLVKQQICSNVPLLVTLWLSFISLGAVLLSLGLVVLSLGALATGVFEVVLPVPSMIPLFADMVFWPLIQLFLFMDVVGAAVTSRFLMEEAESDPDIEALPFAKH